MSEDPVVEANRALLLARSEVGMTKYGTSLASSGLTTMQFAQHALEEALDLANYLQAIIRSKSEEQEGSQLYSWLVRASKCGVPSIESAAQVMKDYYEGVGPEPEYAARELDVEAERREFEADEIESQQARHPQEPLTDDQKAYLLRRDPQQRDSYAACGGEWDGWLRRAARSAAQSTAPMQDFDDWCERANNLPTFGPNEGVYAVRALKWAESAWKAAIESQASAAPVSTEQAGDARDAARYRHIKADNHQCADNTFCLFLDLDGNLLPVASADMDAEIDAAMLEAAPSPNNSPVGADKEPK